MEIFEPILPRLCRIWERLTQEQQNQRLLEARRRRTLVLDVASRQPEQSERAASKKLVPIVDRSSFRRWQDQYRMYGFDGLVDSRLPPRSKETPEQVRAAIRTLRQADANIAVQTIIAHVKKYHNCEVESTTVKTILREAGLSRKRGVACLDSHAGELRLELAGMKLVEAACVQTGYSEALARAIVTIAAEAPSQPQPADLAYRDEFGRFEPQYNDRYRKEPGDAIGPGFASVEHKRDFKDPARFHVAHASAETVERKVWALMVSPLLGSGRWDGIRVSRGNLLEELCGLPYMPSTLELFTRECKFLGVQKTLWEVHARKWHSYTSGWGDVRGAAVLYVDGTGKAVWTQLYSQSSKVSNLGRVMPALETVAFHSGYGVALWQTTYSGRAPLVTEVPALLNELNQVLPDAQVGQIVVIDAEGNSIPFLRGLESAQPSRSWVTRLRPSWVQGKRIFNRTNYRPYRDGDRVRMGVADFEDSKGVPDAGNRD